MKKINRKTIYGLSVTATLALALSSCGTSPEVASAPVKNAIEAFAPTLHVINEEDLQSLDVGKVAKVIRKQKFSNGEVFTYATVQDQVIDGDMVLGSLESMKKAFVDYEDGLKKGMSSQGIMVNRCSFGRYFSSCLGPFEGLRWPESPSVYGNPPRTWVSYEPITGFNSNAVLNIKLAMSEIEANSGYRILFIESNAGSRIRFTQQVDPAQSGCWSRLGYQGGVQDLNLGDGCQTKGIAIHELLHALGMVHEHQRPDRDQFITINSSNITPYGSSALNFAYWDRDVTEWSTFDLGSIMMYPENLGSLFVVNTAIPAFTLKVPNYFNVEIGQRNGMSERDILTLRERYSK